MMLIVSPLAGGVTSGGTGAHSLETWLRRAMGAGTKFVVVSPLRSDIPDFLDAQWIPIRPNTDTALMLTVLAEPDSRDPYRLPWRET